MRNSILVTILLFIVSIQLRAQDIYKTYRTDWLEKAELYKPELNVSEIIPKGIVKVIAKKAAFQGTSTKQIMDMTTFYKTPLKSQKNIVVDFGRHVVGHVQFVIRGNAALHAPLRLRLKFGEVPSIIKGDFSEYNGSLSSAWLQEEIVTIHFMPDTIRLPHRYAFRYIEIEHLGSASDMDFYFEDITCFAITSAGDDIFDEKPVLSNDFEAISEVSLRTLSECMQTVFEDGPKRDRRIWVGDLKLQALANYYSFQDYDLVRRGLYMYGATADSGGLVYGTLLEKPFLHGQKHHPIDYCLLYASIFTDYYKATGDEEPLEDLWSVIKYQVLQTMPFVNEKGLFTMSDKWWLFVDWNNQLHKQASLQAIAIYSYSKTLDIARLLDKTDELPGLDKLIDKMKKSAKKHYFDKKNGVFVSGENHQVSMASQTWMILSETVSSKEGKGILQRVLADSSVVQPVSPYMYHYVVEALASCGMNEKAKELLLTYWGGMVEKGADTFWEVYDPTNDFLSPYGSYLMNSYCHAWSCTPVYFLRKYQYDWFKK